MAFTAAEKDKVAAFLGYPITSDNQSAIDDACSAVEGLSSDAVTRVQGYLTTLGTIDTEIATARTTVGSAVSQLQSQGRRFVALVAMSLNLEVRQDYYSG